MMTPRFNESLWSLSTGTSLTVSQHVTPGRHLLVKLGENSCSALLYHHEPSSLLTSSIRLTLYSGAARHCRNEGTEALVVSAGVCQSGPDCRQNSKANTDEAFVCSPSWILWRAAVVQRFHQHDRLLLGGEELIAVGPEQPSTSISRPFLPPLRGWRLGETRRWGGTRESWRGQRDVGKIWFLLTSQANNLQNKVRSAAVLMGNSGHQTDSHRLRGKLPNCCWNYALQKVDPFPIKWDQETNYGHVIRKWIVTKFLGLFILIGGIKIMQIVSALDVKFQDLMKLGRWWSPNK